MATSEMVATAAAAQAQGTNGRPARSVDQVTRTPDSPARAPRSGSVRQALDYQLLTPPNYNNIVGGAPPSPIASVLLLIGTVMIFVAVIVAAFGPDTSQWWEAGAVLAALGMFLAAFVTRR